MGQDGTKGRKPVGSTSGTTDAMRLAAVPYFRMGWSDEQIGTLFKRSAHAVHKWRSSDAVKRALGEVAEHVIDATKERATDLASKAWDTLEELLRSEDDRIRLDAAKTVLDRKGHPAASKSEVTGADGGPLQHDIRVAIMPLDVAREVAQDGPMRHSVALPAEGEHDDDE